MLGGVGATTVVKGVGIGQKRYGSLFSYIPDYRGREVGPEISQISRFTEMYLYSRHFFVEVNLIYSRLYHQSFQFVQEVAARLDP